MLLQDVDEGEWEEYRQSPPPPPIHSVTTPPPFSSLLLQDVDEEEWEEYRQSDRRISDITCQAPSGERNDAFSSSAYGDDSEYPHPWRSGVCVCVCVCV